MSRERSEIRWRAALPYLAGATLGLPLGLWLLRHLDPARLAKVDAQDNRTG